MSQKPLTHAVHRVRGATPFRWPVRVYYEDTDAAGVVYYASYLRFLERARTEWLASLGFTLSALEQAHSWRPARIPGPIARTLKEHA